MWNFIDEILEKFSMSVNEELSQAGPRKLRIIEVDHNRDSSKQSIEQIIKVNKNILRKYFIHPIKKTAVVNEFVNKIHVDL
jgi:hypothetical protein